MNVDATRPQEARVAPVPLLPLARAVRERLTRTPLLLFLDVDGTLAPIAPRPEDAGVPPETRRAVAAVAAQDGVHVALVSGRSATDARRMVAVSHVWAVGNHGCEAIGPDGEQIVDPEAAPYEGAMARAARALEALLQPVQGVIVEDKRWTLSVHVRLADPAIVPRVKATVDRVAAEGGLVVRDGKMVFEVRPPVRVNKGTAVLALARRLASAAGTVAFVGDDQTDEDAFRALRQVYGATSVTVRVAPSEAMPTVAEFSLADPSEVRRFLEDLVTLRSGRARAMD